MYIYFFLNISFYSIWTYLDNNRSYIDGAPTEIGNHPSSDEIAMTNHHSSNEHKYSGMSAAERLDRERYYATVRKPMSQQQQQNSVADDLDRIPEYSEDIYPYATFHLSDQVNLSNTQVMIGRRESSSDIMSHAHLPKFI